ncbi:carbon-nitrogen family hydrolase [Lentibacillus sp. N15]|uniref:carbon-nitrogen family hydrolase n=1 Tax=Lentibacillus songyuanensis TaxID=3136161 RepID=UPI0031BA2E21
MKVQSFQFEVIFGDVDENLKKVLSLFDKADLTDTDTVVLPEMWTTGYDLERIHEIAADHLEPVKSFIQNLAKTYDVNIIAGSIANNKGNGISNTAFVINRNGEFIHEYSKIHLVPMLNEPEFLTGGTSEVETFELDGEKVGMLICYDLRFPEVFRDLALDDAKVIFVVAEWPIERTEHWITLLKARAIENQCYIVSSNIVGTQPTGTTFAGHSMIVNPFGEVLAEADNQSETSVEATLDLEYIKKIRKDIPIFDSRRKALYKFL